MKGLLKKIVQKVVDSNAEQVAHIGLLKFNFSGSLSDRLYERNQGQSDPKTVNDLLKELLGNIS